MGVTVSVPEGAVWATVVRLVHRNIGSFGPEDAPLLLALIEDAVRGVSWWADALLDNEGGAGHPCIVAHVTIRGHVFHPLDARVRRVRASLNPGLDIEGVLLTMYDERTNLGQQVTREVREFFKEKVF